MIRAEVRRIDRTERKQAERRRTADTIARNAARRSSRTLLDSEVLMAAAVDPELHTMFARLTKAPASTGRHEKYPPFLAGLISLFVMQSGSQQRGLRVVAENWGPLQILLAARYPGYVGLELGAGAPTKDDYRRYARRHGFSGDRLNAEFEHLAARQAGQAGIGKNTDGTLFLPSPTAIVTVDGTVLKPLFKNTPKTLIRIEGTGYVDEETGEVIDAEYRTPRYDPDCRWHSVGGNDDPTIHLDKNGRVQDDKGGRTHGTKFVVALGSNGHKNQLYVLSVRHCAGINPAQEAAVGVDMLLAVKESLPGLLMALYDKALRGKHAQTLYEHGYLPQFKGYDNGSDDIVYFETRQLVLPDGTTEDVKIYSHNYGFAVQGIDQGEMCWVPLTPFNYEQRKTPAGSYRHYGLMQIPNDPRLPAEWAHKVLRLRLDQTEADIDAGRNRPEHVRLHPPNTDHGKQFNGRRNLSEMINRWKKRILQDKRARAVGKDGQHLDLIGAALYRNYQSLILRRNSQAAEDPDLGVAA